MVVSDVAFTLDDSARLAERAKLRFSKEELERVTADLNDILLYVEQLAGVDTTDVPPMIHPLDFAAELREDKPAKSLSSADALVNAPDKSGDFFKVPSILGGEGEES